MTISITLSWKQNPSWITTKSNDGKIWQIKVFPPKINDLHRLRTQPHVSNKINIGFNVFNLALGSITSSYYTCRGYNQGQTHR